MRHLIRYALPLLLLALSFAASAQNAKDDSCLNIVRQNKRDKAEVIALGQLGSDYSNIDVHRAMSFHFEKIAVSLEIGLYKQVGEGYAGLVYNHQDLGQQDSAVYYLEKLKILAQRHPETHESYAHAAGLYYKRRMDYRSAVPFLLESIQDAEKLQREDSSIFHITNLAGANLNVANAEAAMEDYKTSERYATEALKLFEKVGNKKGISYCYQILGNNFLSLRQLNTAEDYTRKALVLKTEMNDTRGSANSLQQLGAIFRYRKKFDSALHYNLVALDTNLRLGLQVEQEGLDLEIGNVYKDMHNDTAAERYFVQGKALASARNDSILVSTFDAALISVRKNGEDLVLTEQRLLNSVNAQIRANNTTNLLITYTYLVDHYAKTGQTKKGMEYLTRYYVLNDSLEDLNTALQIKKIEGQYNVDKKEQEIALLKKDQQLSHVNLEKQTAVLTAQNAVLAKQKLFEYGAVLLLALLVLIGFLVINRNRIVNRARRAIELEKMRNHIARDLHDDIGSTLSSINILSKVALQAPSADGPQTSLEKIRDRSAAIMEKMDDIVWTINPQNDTMEQLLYRMKEFAAEILEPLNINYSFEEDGDFTTLKLDIRKRKDLYLVFKEAINNAAKYSQCNNLHIRLRREGDSLQMQINDDGKGFAAETVRNGNGLNNMQERATSMFGKLKIDSKLGQGTRVGLDLPIT